MKRADILTKKAVLEVLEELFGVLDRAEEDTKTTWGKLDKMVIKTEWNSETRKCEEVYDENGEPVMVNDCGIVPKRPEEFTPEDNAKLEAIKAVKVALEKLI